MFINQNQLARELRCISRIHVTVAGLPASSHDRRQFQTVTLMRYGLECDLSGVSSFSTCVYRRVIHGLTSVDLRSYASDMKYVKLAYIRERCEAQEFSWRSFKRCVAERITNKWILVVLANLSDSFSKALQWLSFDERLLLDTNSDTSDEEDAYIEFEEHLYDRPYPDETISDLTDIISDFLRDFSFGLKSPEPKFGPGTVADGKGRMPHLSKVINCVYDAQVVEELCSIFGCESDDLIVGHAGYASTCNRIIFRPKNALSHRIISAEPTWLSWLQQAIKSALFDYVESSPKMFTWFSNQGRSRELALKGSVDGSYATVDFSSASDSVTVELVARLYSKTWVVDALLLTRSTHAQLPTRGIIPLRKFAPMGSATCFATMDIIILSMCELAIRRSLGRGGRPGDYVVYGDDATIRQEAVRAFLELSEDLHFAVNVDKSYVKTNTPHYYRESCGIEAFDGVDVTPIRYSRFQEPLIACGPVSYEWWSQAIDLLNRLIVEGYLLNTRSAAIELIKYSIGRAGRRKAICTSIWNNVLRVDYTDYITGKFSPVEGYDGPLCVVVPDGTATNYRCKHGRDANTQRPYVQVRVNQISINDRHQANHERELLDLWYHVAPADGGSEDSDSGPILEAAAGIQSQRWGWTRHLI